MIGHSEPMMIVHVDLENGKFHAVSIPRDTRVYLDGYGYTKLAGVQYILQGFKGPKQGIKRTVKIIRDLTGVLIHDYVEFDFDLEGLQSMVGVMGGIPMDVPVNVYLGSTVIKASTHVADGKTAASLISGSHSFPTKEYGGQQLQLEASKGMRKSPKLRQYCKTASGSRSR